MLLRERNIILQVAAHRAQKAKITHWWVGPINKKKNNKNSLLLHSLFFTFIIQKKIRSNYRNELFIFYPFALRKKRKKLIQRFIFFKHHF